MHIIYAVTTCSDKVYNQLFGRIKVKPAFQSQKYHRLLIEGLAKGEDYNNLFDTYVIFITKEDVLGKGLPIYHVKRTIDETGDAFNDGSYIIYVNGELTNDNTALGRLVHDFSCLHSKDIYYETLKECVKRYKETEEGIQTMCTVMEELRNEGIQQGMKQGKNLGMQKFAELTKQLLALGRTNDLSRATVDEEYRDKLFKELAIQ